MLSRNCPWVCGVTACPPMKMEKMMVMTVMVARLRLGIRVFGLQIDHQQAQRLAHLNGGKANAARVIHRLKHIGDERF